MWTNCALAYTRSTWLCGSFTVKSRITWPLALGRTAYEVRTLRRIPLDLLYPFLLSYRPMWIRLLFYHFNLHGFTNLYKGTIRPSHQTRPCQAAAERTDRRVHQGNGTVRRSSRGRYPPLIPVCKPNYLRIKWASLHHGAARTH